MAINSCSARAQKLFANLPFNTCCRYLSLSPSLFFFYSWNISHHKFLILFFDRLYANILDVCWKHPNGSREKKYSMFNGKKLKSQWHFSNSSIVVARCAHSSEVNPKKKNTHSMETIKKWDRKNKFRVRASRMMKKTFTNCIIWVLKFLHFNVDLLISMSDSELVI